MATDVAASPIDPEALARSLGPFGHSVGLPAEAYISREVFAWEREHFFDASWVCLGRAGLERRRPDSISWRGWEFGNVSGDATPFERHVGYIDEYLAPYEPERLVVGAHHTYELAANWKLINENYQECYHCSEIHPELCRVSPPESGGRLPHDGLYVSGPMDLRPEAETMSLDGRSGGIPLRGLSGELLRQVGYVGLWPNLLISPHPDYVLTHRIEPLAADRSLVECEWLFPPELVERPDFDPSWAVEFWDVTNGEDWDAVESIQRGAGSRGFRPGPLSAWWELGVYLFVQMVATGYLEGGVTRPPELPS
jgi:Rieske 2Fe-2S family protein